VLFQQELSFFAAAEKPGNGIPHPEQPPLTGPITQNENLSPPEAFAPALVVSGNAPVDAAASVGSVFVGGH
jgi:hypothetical protein